MPSPTSLQRGMVSAQAPHFNTPLLPEFGTSTRKSSSSFPEVMSYQISIKFTEKRLLQIPEGQIPKRGQPLGPCTLPVFPTGAPNDLHSTNRKWAWRQSSFSNDSPHCPPVPHPGALPRPELQESCPGRYVQLTFQKANLGLGKPLHQPSHEELRAKELRRYKTSIFQEANFIGRELHPF